jgi:probable HAF family extracellular repeat protein
MRSPHRWLIAGTLGLALTAGAQRPAAQEGRVFEYFGFDAVPDATATNPQGINARGDIVGSYTKGGVTHGFVWSEGVLTSIDYPGAVSTDARGINARGDIVGAYRVAGEPAVNIHGYLLSKHGEFSPVDFPNHTSTIPQRITANGLILGCRHDTDTMVTMRGIMMNAKDLDGGGTDIDAFGSMNNGASSDGRVIVGLYTDMDTMRGRGYVLRGGSDFVPFDVPGSSGTAAWDVNDSGAIVGVYRDAANIQHGFVWSGPLSESIDVPGARSTRAFGINARGTVVGSYNDASNKVRGFIAIRRP